MKVKCQIARSDRGFEGVITDRFGVTLYNTGFQGCAEDADGLMEIVILKNKWEVDNTTTPPQMDGW